MKFSRTNDARLVVTFRDNFELQEFLAKPCNGDGGGQVFVRGMQRCFSYYNSIRPRLEFELSHSQTEAWTRNALDYGDGGFQRHLGKQELQAFIGEELKR